jgi:hypothetical protein
MSIVSPMKIERTSLRQLFDNPQPFFRTCRSGESNRSNTRGNAPAQDQRKITVATSVLFFSHAFVKSSGLPAGWEFGVPTKAKGGTPKRVVVVSKCRQNSDPLHQLKSWNGNHASA